MLSVAAVGMLGYGVWSAGVAVADLVVAHRLEIWADVAALAFGLLLALAAPLVRVRMPGGLALAIGALLGLQALALHEAAHLYGAIAIVPQVTRGLFALLLVLLAHFGEKPSSGQER